MYASMLSKAGTTLAGMSRSAKIGTVVGMAALGVAIAGLVFVTGGVRFAYLHLMYIPIVVSGLAFGVQGGLAAGVIGGLLLGPFMPQNTTLGLAQDWHNWLWRLAMFGF